MITTYNFSEKHSNTFCCLPFVYQLQVVPVSGYTLPRTLLLQEPRWLSWRRPHSAAPALTQPGHWTRGWPIPPSIQRLAPFYLQMEITWRDPDVIYWPCFFLPTLSGLAIFFQTKYCLTSLKPTEFFLCYVDLLSKLLNKKFAFLNKHFHRNYQDNKQLQLFQHKLSPNKGHSYQHSLFRK